MKASIIPILLLILSLSSCEQGSKDTTDTSAETITQEVLDWNLIADVLMSRMSLMPGEQVLLVASPGRFNELVMVLSERFEQSGAKYLGTLSVTDEQPEAWSSEFTRQIQDLSADDMKEALKVVDLGIMMPGPTPMDLAYGLIQDNLNEGIGRTIHFHWAGAYDLNGNLMENDEKVDLAYQTSLIDTDYEALSGKQLNFETMLRTKQVRVTTPAGTDISFNVEDRPVTRQDGDASATRAELAENLIDREVELPAGAIRVAPIEATVNGSIAFPDGMWNGQPVEGLVMEFKEGKLVSFKTTSGEQAVRAELDEAGEAGRSFREFALGFNPTLEIPDQNPWIPYYGYGAGVVRLSLGDNTELGGQVTGGYVRWNFFPDATVIVGDEIWVENGKMIK